MGSIQLKTPIPGPKAQALIERRAAAVSNGLGRASDVVIERAEGALIYDVDGNRLLDLVGGIGMLAVGHSPENIVQAMHEQAQKYIHLCAIVGTYEPYIALAELLNELAPGDFAKKSLLSNSGSEAVETAVNFARYHTGRRAVICFEGAYHGRTLMALTLTSKYSLFKKGLGPFASEVYRLPFPYVYRRPSGMSEADFVAWTCDQLQHALVAQIDPSELAAIIIEPVQGEGGFIPTPPAFMRKIREICDAHNIVMIADEVQCGMGRTGKLFAMEHYDVVADLTVTAKSLGAGMPISAVTGRAEILDAPHPGGVGGTYSGNPLACVAAIEAINTLRQPEFLAHINRLGDIMRETLIGWRDQHPMVGDVRGLGAMVLVEMVLDQETKTPAPNELLAILKAAQKRGVLAMRAGIHANGIRLLPPLVITEEQLHEGLAVLEEALSEVEASLVTPA